jgi:hypothetical protein
MPAVGLIRMPVICCVINEVQYELNGRLLLR